MSPLSRTSKIIDSIIAIDKRLTSWNKETIAAFNKAIITAEDLLNKVSVFEKYDSLPEINARNIAKNIQQLREWLAYYKEEQIGYGSYHDYLLSYKEDRFNKKYAPSNYKSLLSLGYTNEDIRSFTYTDVEDIVDKKILKSEFNWDKIDIRAY